MAVVIVESVLADRERFSYKCVPRIDFSISGSSTYFLLTCACLHRACSVSSLVRSTFASHANTPPLRSRLLCPRVGEREEKEGSERYGLPW